MQQPTNRSGQVPTSLSCMDSEMQPNILSNGDKTVQLNQTLDYHLAGDRLQEPTCERG